MFLLNKSIIFFLIFMHLSSCQIRRSKYAVLIYKIIGQHSHDMNEKHSLKILGTGGAMMNQVEAISLSYTLDETNPDLSFARQLIVECTSELLEKINNDKMVRPYLKCYPFNELHVYVGISFDYRDKDIENTSYLDHVTVARGKISYSTYNHKNQRFEKLHQELYSDGLEIVNHEKK